MGGYDSCTSASVLGWPQQAPCDTKQRRRRGVVVWTHHRSRSSCSSDQRPGCASRCRTCGRFDSIEPRANRLTGVCCQSTRASIDRGRHTQQVRRTPQQKQKRGKRPNAKNKNDERRRGCGDAGGTSRLSLPPSLYSSPPLLGGPRLQAGLACFCGSIVSGLRGRGRSSQSIRFSLAVSLS